MAISNPQQRNSEAPLVHRQIKAPQTARGQFPSKDLNSPESKSFMENAQVPPISGANTGQHNKFTAKSPLVTTMGSTPKK